MAHQGPGGGRSPTPLKPEVSAGTPDFGKLRLSEWTSKDGERRSRVQVVADAVQFLGSPKKAGDPDSGVAEPADNPAVGSYRRKAS